MKFRWWPLLTAVSLLALFYLLPLGWLVLELVNTESFRGFPDFAPKLAGALEDFSEYDTMLRKILVPLIVGASMATSLPRIRSLRTGVLVVTLLAGLTLAAYVLFSLNSEDIEDKWKLHGKTESDFIILKGFSLQTIDSFIAYLALATGISTSREVTERRENDD